MYSLREHFRSWTRSWNRKRECRKNHRKRECRKNHRKYSSVLKFLADLPSDALYFADFSLYAYDLFRCSSSVISFFFRLRPWTSPPVDAHFAKNLKMYAKVHHFQFQSEDLDLALQIAQAVASVLGLSYVKVSFTNYSDSRPLELSMYESLLPALLGSICNGTRSPSLLKRVVLDINSCHKRRVSSDVMALPVTIPIFETFEMHPVCHKSIEENDVKYRFEPFLRNNKSLESLQFSFKLESWQASSTLETMMESILLSGYSALGGAQHNDNKRLHKLELKMELEVACGVPVIVHEASKIITLMLNAGSTLGRLSLLIESTFRLHIQFQHGVFVKLHVSACDEVGAQIVEEALRLNRGPNVLSLDTLLPSATRTILSPLIPDLTGHQANTSVSTLRLSTTSKHDHCDAHTKFLEERLEEVANMMETNSTVERLDVWNSWLARTCYDPECSPVHSPVATRLQNIRLRSGALRSFTFNGQELHKFPPRAASAADGDVEKQHACKTKEVIKVQEVKKVECRKHVKPDQEMNVIVSMKRERKH